MCVFIAMGIIADFWTTNKILKEKSFQEDAIILNDTESWLSVALNRQVIELYKQKNVQ